MRKEPRVTHEQINGQTVCRVELTKDKTAIIDPADWSRVAAEHGTRWAAVSNGAGLWSARKAYKRTDGRVVMMTLARAVMQAEDGQRVETANGNALDVRRRNLSYAWNPREQRQAEANRRWREKLGTANPEPA